MILFLTVSPILFDTLGSVHNLNEESKSRFESQSSVGLRNVDLASVYIDGDVGENLIYG